MVWLTGNSHDWSSGCPGPTFLAAGISALACHPASSTLTPILHPYSHPPHPHSRALQAHGWSVSLILHEAEPSGKSALLRTRGPAAFPPLRTQPDWWVVGPAGPASPSLGFQRWQAPVPWASFFSRDSDSERGGWGFPALADAGRRRLQMRVTRSGGLTAPHASPGEPCTGGARVKFKPWNCLGDYS